MSFISDVKKDEKYKERPSEEQDRQPEEEEGETIPQ